MIENIVTTKTACPLCQNELLIRWQKDDIPFFGEVMHISSSCTCGFRFSDTLILEQHEAMHYEIRVENAGDLDARVVRSTSGTIRIPELGIDIEPGPASESFVSNVEGVLNRVQEVVEMVAGWETGEKYERAMNILKSLEEIRAGRETITLMIDDPLGNSAIISEKTRKKKLEDSEAESLKTGMIIFEKC